jgi:antitoxin CcdA
MVDTRHAPASRNNTQTLAIAPGLAIDAVHAKDAMQTAEAKCLDREGWNAENKNAIDYYNARIATEGLPLAQYRTF